MSDQAEQARPAPAFRYDPPFRLNMEQQRKRAKELREAFLSGDDAARRRVLQHHPAFRVDSDTTPRPFKLTDAQHVIAREIGLPSWPKLKAHITAMQTTRARIERDPSPADRDMTTLHIRCGSDIKTRLVEAGFHGEFLEPSDPLCQGPVVDEPSWLDRRAGFLADDYGSGVNRNRDDIARGLAAAEASLRDAATRFERVVMWFEHDSYDQLNLSRCLAQFAETMPNRLEMVTLEHFPGGMRFLGLGQLPPEALRLLWNDRKPVSRLQARAGGRVWMLLRQPDPTPLAAAAASGIPELPYLARAVRRHCQEFPWTSDGLGLTERLILQLVAERPHTIGEVFRDLQLGREPLPWMGDLTLKSMVEAMKRASQPVFTSAFETEDIRWFRERLTITPLGLAVLAGEVDWLSLSPPERWLGGVCIRPDMSCWRWDERRGTTTLEPPKAARNPSAPSRP